MEARALDRSGWVSPGAQKVENPGMAERPRYLSWHGDPGRDLTRVGEAVKKSAFGLLSTM